MTSSASRQRTTTVLPMGAVYCYITTVWKKCHIYSEGTYLRWKLFYYLKNLEVVESIFIKGDSIMLKKKNEESFQQIKSISDISWLNLQAKDYEALGFGKTQF